MKPDKALERLGLEDDFDSYRRCPALLDTSLIDGFIIWLNDHIDFYERLENHSIRIGVLQHQIENRSDWDTLEPQLRNLHIELLADAPIHSDDILVNEILHAYFNGVGVYRKVAQLLAYGRKHVEDNDDIHIITQLRVFRLIPGVQQFYIPSIAYRGRDEEAFYLRAVDALGIDQRVWQAAEDQMRIGDYPSALLKAVNVFYSELRRISKSTEDGSNLIDQTLMANSPSIQLTALSSTTERNEQKGYAQFAYGAHNVIRNVISHHLGDREYLQKRFGKRHTALKFLCLLSLLFEKLEAPW
jgi:uncharacterized protein (TIGR02391 family)